MKKLDPGMKIILGVVLGTIAVIGITHLALHLSNKPKTA